MASSLPVAPAPRKPARLIPVFSPCVARKSIGTADRRNTTQSHNRPAKRTSPRHRRCIVRRSHATAGSMRASVSRLVWRHVWRQLERGPSRGDTLKLPDSYKPSGTAHGTYCMIVVLYTNNIRLLIAYLALLGRRLFQICTTDRRNAWDVGILHWLHDYPIRI